MAQALKRLYGDVKFGVGPVIEGGFYYDFDMDDKVSSDDFDKIEKTMKQIVNENHKIVREVVSKEKAKDFFKDDPYKLELIDAIPEDESVTLYTQGELLIYVEVYTYLLLLKLKSSNYYLQLVLIGVEIVIIKCYNEFMVQHSLTKDLKAHLKCWKNVVSVIIVKLVKI